MDEPQNPPCRHIRLEKDLTLPCPYPGCYNYDSGPLFYRVKFPEQYPFGMWGKEGEEVPIDYKIKTERFVNKQVSTSWGTYYYWEKYEWTLLEQWYK